MSGISRNEIKALVTNKKNMGASCIAGFKKMPRKQKEAALNRLSILYEQVVTLVVDEDDEEFNAMWDRMEAKAEQAVTKKTARKSA